MYSLPRAYKIGLEVIDQQHGRILSVLEQCVLYLSNDKKLTLMNSEEYVAELRSYAHTHFVYEEKLLEKEQYPQIKEHQAMHQVFIHKVTMLEREAKLQEKEKVREIALFLKHWFMEHIQKEDRRFADFINGKKGAPNPSKL